MSVIAIDSAIAKIKQFSDAHGLDISVRLDQDDSSVCYLCFLKSSELVEDDCDEFTEYLKSFVTTTSRVFIGRTTDQFTVEVLVSETGTYNELLEVSIRYPKSEYTLTAIHTYLSVAREIDPLINL